MPEPLDVKGKIKEAIRLLSQEHMNLLHEVEAKRDAINYLGDALDDLEKGVDTF